jgi:hypothetical protein
MAVPTLREILKLYDMSDSPVTAADRRDLEGFAPCGADAPRPAELRARPQ